MKVALVGNQNSGKSTLFNTLTGLNQKIGNWPGVTIEKKTGKIIDTDIDLIDLPGIYSLNAYTKEEEVTSKFLLQEGADTIINIIDCNSIARGLYLTMQLLKCNLDVIVALNMHEFAERKGIQIDEKKLSQELNNIPVIKISAITGQGIEKIIQSLTKETRHLFKSVQSLSKIKQNISIEELKKWKQEITIKETYQKIDLILDKVVTIKKEKTASMSDISTITSITDKLDKVFLNKVAAIPIFIMIMFLIYYISIEIIGSYTMDGINELIQNLSQSIETFLLKNGAWPALTSLLSDGILSGISAVISFLPQLLFLFIMISCMEKVGYMSRISLIWDKIFKKIGMSGSSVISFILGTGCSVPGIMVTRTIKNENEKKITSILTPFIPCSAKLPIISLFSTYFFKENSGFIAISFYFISIVVIIFSGILFRKITKTKYKNSFISELPEYRMPRFKQILRDSFEKVWDFVKRAGSIILLSSIVVWLLLSFSFRLEYGINIQDSMLAYIGRTFSWIFVPMTGENSWEIAVSSIQGLIAKEQVVSSMAIIAGLENENISSNIFATGSPFTFFTSVSAYAYVCFNLFSAPCFGAISAMKKTLGGTKNMLKAVGFQIGLAYLISCLVYGIGRYIL